MIPKTPIPPRIFYFKALISVRWGCFEPLSLILSFRNFTNLGKNFTPIPNQTHTQSLLNSSHLVISPSLFSVRWHHTRDDREVMSSATPTKPSCPSGKAREQLVLSWWHTHGQGLKSHVPFYLSLCSRRMICAQEIERNIIQGKTTPFPNVFPKKLSQP